MNLSEGGVNFAVAGATALPDSFFVDKGVKNPHANVSLMDQLSWFQKMFLPKFCHDPAGKNCVSGWNKCFNMQSSIYIISKVVYFI